MARTMQLRTHHLRMELHQTQTGANATSPTAAYSFGRARGLSASVAPGRTDKQLHGTFFAEAPFTGMATEVLRRAKQAIVISARFFTKNSIHKRLIALLR